MKAAALLSLAIVALCPYAQAKCVEVSIPVSGRVASTNGTPIAKAVVKLEWSEIGGLETRIATANTDSHGNFSTPVVFYPWREGKWFWGYRCDSPPPSLKLLVEAAGHIAHRSTVQSKYEGTELRISLAAAP